MARPKKSEYFTCKDCHIEFRKKAYTPEQVERGLCQQCYTVRVQKAQEEAKDVEEYKKVVETEDFKFLDVKQKIECFIKISIPFPHHPARPSVKTDATAAEARKYADNLEIYEKEMIEYKKAKEAYGIEEEKRYRWFKRWAVSECLPDDMPDFQKEKVYAKAWKDGHSSGAYEVYMHLQELADLFIK